MNIKHIFKTFEMFLSIPMSIFQRGFIHIMHLEDNVFSKKSTMNAYLHHKGVQVNVINNQRMYSILSNTIHKKNQKQPVSSGNFGLTLKGGR